MATTSSSIFALSSAPGRAGVAVIRLSGPAVPVALSHMAAPAPGHGQAAFRTVRHPETGEALDRAVVLFFAGPKSETGEDVAEFQVHGGRAVVASVLAALALIPGCRMAEAGEFARRAFLNGKLDLAEVEGLADLVDAETDAQRRQALAQSSGVLSRLYEGWRQQLLQAMALAEAAIDFADEGDVGDRAMHAALTAAGPLAQAIEKHLADGHRGEILREGFRVALLGAPNAGKSSLLNALARRNAAIVSEEAGTTRDVIEVRLDLAGVPVIVSDTAGIRETEGSIEREGIRRSLAAARDAHLNLWLSETGFDSPPSEISRETILYVRTKADLDSIASPPANLAQPSSAWTGERPGGDVVRISNKTGAGLDLLLQRIASAAAQATASGTGQPALTRFRHRRALEECLASLTAFQSGDPMAPELRAEDLRQAAHALGRITGRVDVEDVLGEIFGRFCIGK